MSIKLIKSCEHWGKHEFDSVFKNELYALPAHQLIPDTVISPGHILQAENIHAIILTRSETSTHVVIKVAMQFQELLQGYCCGDDEPAMNLSQRIAEVKINKATSEANIVYSQDD